MSTELRKPAVATMLFLLYLVLSVAWNYWFDSAPDASRQELRGILAQIIVLFVLIVPWVGLWAIVGGISLHRSNIATHLSIASLFLFAAKSLYIVTDYAYFSFASFLISSSILLVVSAVLVFYLFFLHLLGATNKSRRSAGRLSATITFCLLGAIVLGVYADSMSFSDDIPFEASLKPPAFKLVRSSSVEEFLAESEKLRPAIDEAAQVR